MITKTLYDILTDLITEVIILKEKGDQHEHDIIEDTIREYRTEIIDRIMEVIKEELYAKGDEKI